MTSLSCPHLCPAISSSRRPLASHRCLRPLRVAPLLLFRLSVESVHCSRQMMKRAAWLLLVRSRAVLGDQAQKRKMRYKDGIRADWQTAVYRSKYALCVTKTDKSYAIVATRDSRSDQEKYGRRPYAALVAKTHGKPIGRSSRMERPWTVQRARRCSRRGTELDWTAEQQSVGAARRYRTYRNDCSF